MLSLSSHSVRAHTHSVNCQLLRCTNIRSYQYCPHQLQLVRPSHRAVERCTGLVVRGSKEELEKQLDLTQQTLERALQRFQAAAQTQTPSKTNDDVLAVREQQLWDRQQAMLDKMQQQWELERKAWIQKEACWHSREQNLLSELDNLRKELQTLLTSQAAAAAAAVSYPQAGSSTNAAAATITSSSSSRSGVSDAPGAAVISGPSSASAAVASAIRAVRDAHVNSPTDAAAAAAPAAADGTTSAAGTSEGSWEHLFTADASSNGSSSSSSTAVDSVTAAMAAVDQADVLSDMDLNYNTPSSRGRRRVNLSAASSSNGSSSSSGNTTSSSSGSSSVPVETVKGDPSGPPPMLSIGDDDIFWVSKLHNGLLEAGFYPSDDEIENWMFAEGTQSALLTFQACNGVTESGTTCELTWRKLLGEDHYEATYGSSSSSSSTAVVAPAAAAAAGSSDGVMVQEEEEAVTYSFSSSSSSSRWPVLMDMDGGKEVHALQVLLAKAGFFCGDDEMRWWQFGSMTTDALKTFQACQGLPESGVCDERTWLALLGDEASPEDLESIQGAESSYEDDMTATHEGAVWLLGEQRWSRPVNGTSADEQ